MFQPDDVVNVIDGSYSSVIEDGEFYHFYNLPVYNPWIVIESGLKLPLNKVWREVNTIRNDTIIRSGKLIAFIRSDFLRRVTCPTCGK